MLPSAIEAGLSERDFIHMTPASIRRHIDAFWKRRKNEWEKTEYESWLSGWYVLNAIGTAFGKHHKYPENPMKQTQVVVEDLELTEEEADEYRKQFIKRLQRMEAKFNKAKERENGFEVVKEPGK